MSVFGPRLKQGKMLDTERTRAMSAAERSDLKRKWECRVFAHHSPCDKRFVAEFRTPDMAREFVRLINQEKKA